MTCNLEDEFPKTYAKMEELYYEEHKMKAVSWLWFLTKDIPLTTLELTQALNERLVKVQQPIWSLCEELLLGNYEMEFPSENKDKLTIAVADQEFSVNKVYHMFEETVVTPDVTENRTESRLLVSVINQVRYYELHGKFREELLDYFKGVQYECKRAR
tara:strand:+ start:7815 stop:8288 length:474 start_codon:yes stop_codon:yes gene_type:complete